MTIIAIYVGSAGLLICVIGLVLLLLTGKDAHVRWKPPIVTTLCGGLLLLVAGDALVIVDWGKVYSWPRFTSSILLAFGGTLILSGLIRYEIKDVPQQPDMIVAMMSRGSLKLILAGIGLLAVGVFVYILGYI